MTYNKKSSLLVGDNPRAQAKVIHCNTVWSISQKSGVKMQLDMKVNITANKYTDFK